MNPIVTRWRGIERSKLQGVLLYGIIYIGFLLGHGVIVTGAEGVFVYYDSYEYYRDGLLSLTDSRFWASGRPPVSLIFYKLFGGYEFESHYAGVSVAPWATGPDVVIGRVTGFVNDDVALVYAQTAAYLVAFSLLAFACVKSGQTGKGRLALFIFPLLFSFVPSVLRWNFMALSESFSISLFVIFVAVWSLFLQTRRSSWLVGVAIVGLLWAGVRDTNAYVLVMIALVLMAVFVRSCSLKRGSMMALGVWFVCIFMLSDFSADTGKRWVNPLYNNICKRILPVHEYVTYFSDQGMPVTPELMRRSGKHAPLDDWAIYRDPSLEKFRAWSLEHGKTTYAKFLVTHIAYAITAPIFQPRNVAMGFLSYVYDVREVGALHYGNPHIPPPSHLPIAWIYFLIAYSLTVYYGFRLWRRQWLHLSRCSYLVVPLVMVLLSVPHAWLSWHGDAGGIERHTLIAYIQFQLGFILLLIYAWDHGMWCPRVRTGGG